MPGFTFSLGWTGLATLRRVHGELAAQGAELGGKDLSNVGGCAHWVFFAAPRLISRAGLQEYTQPGRMVAE